MEKGSIVDIYKEGCDTYRACVLNVIGGPEELAKVVNLETGKINEVHCWEVEGPVIQNVFELTIN